MGGGGHTVPFSLACRGLLQLALQRKGEAPAEEEDGETRWLPRLPWGLWVLSLGQSGLGSREASHLGSWALGERDDSGEVLGVKARTKCCS